MSIEVSHPQPHNVPVMKRIWEYCFGDTKEYIDFFFDNCFKPERALVAFYDLKPAGMLFLLPVKLCIAQKEYHGQYIYAVATKPDYRNKGIMRSLEEMAVVKSKEEGLDFLCLVPQSNALFTMYEKLGYKTTFNLGQKTYLPFRSSDESLKRFPCTKEDYLKMRQEYLATMPAYLDFIDPFTKYRYMEFKKAGGEIISVQMEDKVGYYAGYQSEESYIIKETSLDEDSLKKVMCLLTEQYHVDYVKVRGFKGKVNEIIPFGMCKSLSQGFDISFLKSKNPYMNMMLD